MDKLVVFHMGTSTSGIVEAHSHSFTIYESQLADMEDNGSTHTVDTSENNGHSHM